MTDFSHLSDEEFLALSDSDFTEASEVEAAESTVPEDTSDTSESVDQEPTETVDQAEETSDVDESEVTDSTDTDEPSPETAEQDEDTQQDSKDETVDSENEGTVDFESEYKRLLAPFNANGTQMQVNTVDEAITLMQKGANYSKKMQALKPSLKTLKLLGNHDLLEPEKVSLMIDASKGNKEALTQLIKQSGIDPLDLDVKADDSYSPTQYSVDDREMAFDEVMEDHKDLPHFQEAMAVVVDEWDESSKKIVADQPRILADLRTHMEAGIYQKVKAEVTRRRLLGGLENMSDLQAYKQVGEDLNNQGAFSEKPPAAAPVRKAVKAPAQKGDAGLRQRKRVAGAPAQRRSQPATPQQDVLGMSDEEFLATFG